MRFRVQLAASLIGFAALACFAACDANLETKCVGGDGTCDLHQLNGPASSSVGGGVCLSECDITAESNQTGEFPCEVDAILDNCRRCHTDPPQPGVPFPLVTYEDSQKLYLGQAIYARMKKALEDDFMPLEPPLLTEEEKATMIDDWICSCALPRDPGQTCN